MALQYSIPRMRQIFELSANTCLVPVEVSWHSYTTHDTGKLMEIIVLWNHMEIVDS